MKSYFVIIPVFNPPEGFVEHFGDLSVRSGIPDERIILVDDGSTNGIPDEIGERHPECRVLKGDGSLWWCGGMRVGMEEALDLNADVVVWLNHDCLPDPGAVEAIAEEAGRSGRGCVSAWCYCSDAPESAVNPGFRRFREIPQRELEAGGLVEVDGVNGNCVALNADAIRKVGLPDAERHPHYGDGPYTYRLHKAGFRNFVLPSSRAALDRDYTRCVSVFWRCAFWHGSLIGKCRYYFGSYRSQFHWRHRFNDTLVFRGALLGAPVYLWTMFRLFLGVAGGHGFGIVVPVKKRLKMVCRRYGGKLPVGKLAESLAALQDG